MEPELMHKPIKNPNLKTSKTRYRKQIIIKKKSKLSSLSSVKHESIGSIFIPSTISLNFNTLYIVRRAYDITQ